MTPPTILIADDDPNIRHLVRIALESGDFTVDEAEDGCEAFPRSRWGSVDPINRNRLQANIYS